MHVEGCDLVTFVLIEELIIVVALLFALIVRDRWKPPALDSCVVGIDMRVRARDAGRAVYTPCIHSVNPVRRKHRMAQSITRVGCWCNLEQLEPFQRVVVVRSLGI